MAILVYYGLYALQHRGQESAGLAVGDGHRLRVFKDMGLVSQVFDGPTLAALQGRLVIGHTRYSTTGGSRWEVAQPVFKSDAARGGFAVAHNGNLTNAATLAAELAGDPHGGALVQPVVASSRAAPFGARAAATSDTGVVAELLAGEVDLSMEALTETAAPAGTGPARGLCTARFTGSCPIPIPDAAGPNLTPSAATQPSTLPLPNP